MEESTQKDTRQPSTGSSNLTITDFYNLVKHDANFAKYFSDEVAYKAEGLDTLQEESKALESQRRDLKEERANWMNSDEVKAIEAKKKSYGIFSAEGKAYRESAEYQNYLAKRKEFNQHGEELTARISEVDDALREANDRLEARKREIRNDQQTNYMYVLLFSVKMGPGFSPDPNIYYRAKINKKKSYEPRNFER